MHLDATMPSDLPAAAPHHRLDVLSFGEPLVEFNQTGEAGGRLYLQGFGGDTSNFAIAAARQGARAGCWSAVGNDEHGAMLRALWRAEGVDDRCVKTDPLAPTGVYMVRHDEGGHHFSFLRAGSAASRVTPADLPLQQLAAVRVLHLSGITLAISNPSCDAAHAAIDAAHQAGAWVSFDTNLRLKLWPLARARAAMSDVMRRCEICLPSLDDVSAITGLSDPTAIVDQCLALGARIVALKLGAQGAIVASAEQRHVIAPVACTPVDATGAGDTFGGAFVARLLAGDSLLDAGRYAAAAAAMSTEGYGAVEPIPRAEAVRQRMAL
jgi:2-dehydro-3-deoxygluconokinase